MAPVRLQHQKVCFRMLVLTVVAMLVLSKLSLALINSLGGAHGMTMYPTRVLD
jgi:hypothetical protein